MKVRQSLLKDSVTVSTYVGDSAYGPTFKEAVTVPCSTDTTRRLVISTVGDEVVSEATLIIHPDNAALFAPESRIILDGRTSKVLSILPQSFRGNTVLAKVVCL